MKRKSDLIFLAFVKRLTLYARRSGIKYIEWSDDNGIRPLQILMNQGPCKRILYTTKINQTPLEKWFIQHPTNPHILIIRKYGLFHHSFTDMIANLAKSRRKPIHFIGDLDPYDILAFLSLRSAMALQGVKVHYAGIHDEWLGRIIGRKSGFLHYDQISISLDRYEKYMVKQILEFEPDLNRIIGPNSVNLLCSDRKIELEGFSHFLKPDDLAHLIG